MNVTTYMAGLHGITAISVSRNGVFGTPVLASDGDWVHVPVVQEVCPKAFDCWNVHVVSSWTTMPATAKYIGSVYSARDLAPVHVFASRA